MSQNYHYPSDSISVGSITADQGAPNTNANAWPVKVTDGVDVVAVNPDGSINVQIGGGIANPLPVTDAAAETSLASIDGKLNSLGQKVMTGSVPVVIASNQSAVPVSVSSLPLPTGAATEATLLAFSDKTAGALVPEPFDYQDISYVGITTNIDQVIYKTGGSGGTVVATLTMGYDGSQRLTSVTRT